MFNEVDVIINLAATTNFYERYDVAFGSNTLGPHHVLDFSKKCNKLKIMVHVSTGYVCGEREGLILENPTKMGETPNGTRGLDIEAEKNLIEETLNKLNADNNHSQDSIKSAMKELAFQRARKYGWPNTYVFTKAMGEMMLEQFKENIPLVIIRPTMVTSTYNDPFPGWIEGFSLPVVYGNGRITCLPSDPTTIIDAIPADMVVNAIVVAMVAHANQADESSSIYHVGSSVSNPVEGQSLKNACVRYFTADPWIYKDGKPDCVGKVTAFNTMKSFQRYLTICHSLPLKGLQLLNTVCCQSFRRYYIEQCRKVTSLLRKVELYTPYFIFKGVFDDMNTEKLRRAAKESGAEIDIFYFDPKIINWDEYFINTHIPGVVKRYTRK